MIGRKVIFTSFVKCFWWICRLFLLMHCTMHLAMLQLQSIYFFWTLNGTDQSNLLHLGITNTSDPPGQACIWPHCSLCYQNSILPATQHPYLWYPHLLISPQSPMNISCCYLCSLLWYPSYHMVFLLMEEYLPLHIWCRYPEGGYSKWVPIPPLFQKMGGGMCTWSRLWVIITLATTAAYQTYTTIIPLVG